MDNRRLFKDLRTRKTIDLMVTIITGILGVFNILIASLFILDDLSILAFFGIFGIVFLVVAYKFYSEYASINRRDKYITGLRGTDYASISYLSKVVNKSESYVRDELNNMIIKGWFLQGHVVNKGKLFVVSNRAYQEFKENEKTRPEIKNSSDKYNHLSPEAREALTLGENYLKEIRECNEQIPEAEMTIKISRIETIVDKIFERVANNEDNIDDIKKLMKYYLPTTIKLLNTYIEYNNQPVKGENVEKSMKQIEDTLDTLNKAFEKLLDDLFEETVWDVASDISVLENLLKNDGLTDDDFKI